MPQVRTRISVSVNFVDLFCYIDLSCSVPSETKKGLVVLFKASAVLLFSVSTAYTSRPHSVLFFLHLAEQHSSCVLGLQLIAWLPASH